MTPTRTYGLLRVQLASVNFEVAHERRRGATATREHGVKKLADQWLIA
jgi:hypothetical protein